MKAHKSKAERERLARVTFRKYGRKIPDNATLTNILLNLEKPLRPDFLRCIAPHLRFKPVALEEILYG